MLDANLVFGTAMALDHGSGAGTYYNYDTEFGSNAVLDNEATEWGDDGNTKSVFHFAISKDKAVTGATATLQFFVCTAATATPDVSDTVWYSEAVTVGAGGLAEGTHYRIIPGVDDVRRLLRYVAVGVVNGTAEPTTGAFTAWVAPAGNDQSERY